MATKNDQLFATFARTLGVNNDYFQITTRNPNNADILGSLEHKDIDGFESKVFAACFQEVRNKAGPYKIFGSAENQHVTDCIHRHVNAYNKALQSTRQH